MVPNGGPPIDDRAAVGDTVDGPGPPSQEVHAGEPGRAATDPNSVGGTPELSSELPQRPPTAAPRE